MIHSVLITNLDGFVLYKRYFKLIAPVQQAAWEQTVFTLTQDSWSLTKGEIQQVAEHEDKFLVYSTTGELRVFVTGMDEYDELGLSELLLVLMEAMKEHCGSKKQDKEVTEASAVDQYDKLCLAIDQIIAAGGILDMTDMTKMSALVNMKVDVGKKEKKPIARGPAAPPATFSAKELPKTQEQKREDLHEAFRSRYVESIMSSC